MIRPDGGYNLYSSLFFKWPHVFVHPPPPSPLPACLSQQTSFAAVRPETSVIFLIEGQYCSGDKTSLSGLRRRRQHSQVTETGSLIAIDLWTTPCP